MSLELKGSENYFKKYDSYSLSCPGGQEREEKGKEWIFLYFSKNLSEEIPKNVLNPLESETTSNM